MRILVKIFLIFLFLFTFLPLLQVGYTTNDDTHLYLYFRYTIGSIFLEIVNAYQLAFLNFIHSLRPSLPAVVTAPVIFLINSGQDNPLYARLISIIGNALNIFLLYWALRSVFKSVAVGSFGVLLFLVFAQNSWDHNLLTSYVAHLYCFSLLLSSVICFKISLEKPSKRLLYGSASLYFLSLSYETNIVYLPVFFFMAFTHVRPSTHASIAAVVRRALFQCRYLLGVTFVYTLVYFLIRYFNAANPAELVNVGSRINPDASVGYAVLAGFANFRKIADVVFCHGVSAFPGFVYGYYHGFVREYSPLLHGYALNPLVWITEIKVAWLIKSLIAGSLTYYFLISIKRQDIQQVNPFAGFIAGIYLIFAPGIPVSLVEKYQNWVESGTLGFINTYHSLYGMVFLAVTFFSYLAVSLADSQRGRYFRLLRILVISCIAIGIGLISIVIDHSNSAFTISQIQSNYKWKAVDLFIKSEEFAQLPCGSVIYAPSLFGQIGIMKIFPSYWSDYIAYKTGDTYNILDESALIHSYHRNPGIIFDKPGGKGIKVIGSFMELAKAVNLNKPAKLYYLKFMQDKKNPNQAIILGNIKCLKGKGVVSVFLADGIQVYTLTKHRNFRISLNINPSHAPHVVVNGNVRLKPEGDLISLNINKERGDSAPVKTKLAASIINIESVRVTDFVD